MQRRFFRAAHTDALYHHCHICRFHRDQRCGLAHRASHRHRPHLHQLTQAGLTTTRREGYYVLYSLAPGRLTQLATALTTLTPGAGD